MMQQGLSKKNVASYSYLFSKNNILPLETYVNTNLLPTNVAYSEIRLLMSYVSANIETMGQHLPEDWFGPMEIYVGLVYPLYIGATNEK